MVSPELLYAEKSKGSNISEPKDTEEEEKEEEGKKEDEEEEHHKRRGDDDNSTNSNSSNNSNSNMATLVALAPFDLELTHVLTIVCAFPNNSKPIQAVREF